MEAKLTFKYDRQGDILYIISRLGERQRKQQPRLPMRFSACSTRTQKQDTSAGKRVTLPIVLPEWQYYASHFSRQHYAFQNRGYYFDDT